MITSWYKFLTSGATGQTAYEVPHEAGKAHLRAAGENTTKVVRKNVISLHGQDFIRVGIHPLATLPFLPNTMTLLPLPTLQLHFVNANPPPPPLLPYFLLGLLRYYFLVSLFLLVLCSG